jgi:hypothetical protein
VNGHHVYFSTDFNDVNERDPSVLTVRDTNNDPPGLLELETTYYWAVDEVNILEDPNIWPGLVWDFETSDHINVDNFNSYGPDPALRNVWKDSITGSITKNLAEVFLETTADLVTDGNSMRFYYRNYETSGGKLVGCTAVADTVNLQAGTDWTVVGVKALVLNFRGDTANGQEPHASYTIANDRMWMSLEDGDGNEGIVRYPDMNAVMEASWHQWNIDLQDPCLTDVNMADVAKVYIGFGGVKGGATSKYGAGYQDGIGDPPRCRSALVETDITDDCITNYADVDVMAGDWLQYDYNVPAVAITGAPIGWWKLDEGMGATAYDSAGDNDGNVFDASWSVGYPNDPCDSGLHFDADAIAFYDRVVCAERTGTDPGSYPAELMPDTFTVACWVKLDSFAAWGTFVSNGVDNELGDQSGFSLCARGWAGTDNFCLGIRTEPDIYYVETTSTYETDTWYHLAATYNDANMVYIYVDGELAPCELYSRMGTFVEGPTDVGGPIRWISLDSNSYPDYFLIGTASLDDLPDWWYADASIDDVRVYDYALPPGEIVTLAEQGPARYHEVTSVANLYDLEVKLSKKVNFRDYVILADHWLEGPVLWP